MAVAARRAIARMEEIKRQIKQGGCMYCEKNDSLDNLMILICELPYSKVYLFKNQAHRGRCVVAYKEHADELYELPETELCGFMKDVKTACKAVAAAFSPEKVNLGMYGDTCKHVHFHIVPKQKDGIDFGGVFQMQPQPPVLLSREEYTELIKGIKKKM